jgi:type IV pilus assembly protein PilP
LLYQVRVGNHLGLNYGLVTKIDESEMSLREIVQDATGDWVERQASLVLQERAK